MRIINGLFRELKRYISLKKNKMGFGKNIKQWVWMQVMGYHKTQFQTRRILWHFISLFSKLNTGNVFTTWWYHLTAEAQNTRKIDSHNHRHALYLCRHNVIFFNKMNQMKRPKHSKRRTNKAMLKTRAVIFRPDHR